MLPRPNVRGEALKAASRFQEPTKRMELQCLRYQPIFDLASMDCCGAEALARFGACDEFGALDAGTNTGQAIRALERCGEMVGMGRAILRRCASDWWKVMHRGWRLSINVSPAELSSSGYASFFLETVPHGACVEVEVTETSDVAIQSTALSNLSELRQAGVTVALDDFGEGSNDIQRALDVPCDRLKLSHRVISGFGRSEGAERKVTKVLETAGDLGITVTAEGVETDAQLRFLRSVGCDRAQGYFLCMPTSMAELRRMSPADVLHSPQMIAGN